MFRQHLHTLNCLGHKVKSRSQKRHERRNLRRLISPPNAAHELQRGPNGILIGPEVSRIFAEIILDRIDLDVEFTGEIDQLTKVVSEPTWGAKTTMSLGMSTTFTYSTTMIEFAGISS